MKLFYKIFAVTSIVAAAISFVGCKDDLLQTMDQEVMNLTNKKEVSTKKSGMQRLVFRSRPQLSSTIERLKNTVKPLTRASQIPEDLEFSDNEETFVSFYESQRAQTMSLLTPSQISDLENDPDELEYCLSDSVMPDLEMACLLNAQAEIQMGDTVYRYCSKGVGYTMESNAGALQNLDSLLNLNPGVENSLNPVDLGEGITFVPILRAPQPPGGGDGGGTGGGSTIPDPSMPTPDTNTDGTEDLGSGGGYSGIWSTGASNGKSYSDAQGIHIDGGPFIPEAKMRVVNDKWGDANWATKVLNVGQHYHIVAVKYLSNYSNRKLAMTFYDQNYFIYANIGIKVKLQKKKFGIWWNVKADEIHHGWETVCVSYTHGSNIVPKNPATGNLELPQFTIYENPVSYDKKAFMIHIPIVNYNLNAGKLLGSVFKNAFNNAKKGLTKSLTDEAKKYDSHGLFSLENNKMYIIFGPECRYAVKKRSLESKFYSKWFPYGIKIGFSIGTGFKFNSLEFPDRPRVRLEAGIAYGAVKYCGEWVGAKIIVPKSE